MKAHLTVKSRRDRREEIAGEIKLGARPEDLMKMYGVTHQTIRNACKEHGVKVPEMHTGKALANKKSRDHRLLKIIKKLIQSDASLSKIAEDLGISRQAVHRASTLCKQYGIKIKERGRDTTAKN